MASIFYGLILLCLGLGVMLLTYFLTRAKPLKARRLDLALSPSLDPTSLKVEDAVLVIGSGGRIIYSNQAAREWFSAPESGLNLERLLQRSHPSEVLLSLCVQEGRARFSLDGCLVEGVSYLVPVAIGDNHNEKQESKAMLISLRRSKIAALSDKTQSASQEALTIFADLTRKIVSNLELEPVLQAILECAGQLIQADWSEITRWDAVKRNFIPFRPLGLPGKAHRLVMASERYSLENSLSGYLAVNRTPLLIENIDEEKEDRLKQFPRRFPFLSYLGFPLLVGDELLGTLELASRRANHFTQDDLELLQLLVTQSAVALKNALRFEEEQKQVKKLSGLANLSMAVTNLADAQELFTRLVSGVAELIPVTMVGFLLYRESHHILEAQSPFLGVPDPLLDLYRVEIPPGSLAEEIIQKQDQIIASNAPQDATLKDLGLDGMAVALGIQETILLPLRTATRMLGYLQVADRHDGASFDQEDLKLLELIAVQAAAVIENALLVKESQSRAQRSETLRRVASLAGSNATLDEIMIHSVRELVRLLRADAGLLYLLDEYLGDLELHPASLLNSGELSAIRVKRVNMTETLYKGTATATMQPYFWEDLSLHQSIPEFYLKIFERLDVHSVMTIPFVVRGQGVGELILISREANHFDQNDLTLVSTTASQLSVAIEKTALYGQTDESLRRRVVQLLALNRISRELSTTLELRRLLQVVYEQVAQTTEADCGAIYLFEPTENALPNPKVSFHVGDSITGSLTPVEQKVLRAGEPYIVKDYLSPDPNAPDTVPIPPHPNVRSSLIVPIAYQNYVAGLIHLHALSPGRFDATSQEIAQSLAVQAAIAIGNAQRYQEQQTRNELLNRRVETLTALLETTKYLHAGQPLQESLETIAYGIQSATPFDVVLISVYQPASQCLERVAGAGIPLDQFREMQKRKPHWSSIRGLLRSEFKLGRSYFIPAGQAPDLPKDLAIEQIQLPEERYTESGGEFWQPEDLLLIPLESDEGGLLGLISVDAPRNRLRPDRPAMESLEIFANQAGLIIETYTKINQLSSQSEALRKELEKNHLALARYQQQVEAYSAREKEHIGLLHTADLRLRRLRAALDTADAVDQQNDRSGVLLTLAKQVGISLGLDVVLVGELGSSGPRLLHAVGDIPAGISLQALLGQRNPLRTCFQTGDMITVLDMQSELEWKNSPLLSALETQSFVCLPVLKMTADLELLEPEASVDAVVLGIGRRPLANFGETDAEILKLVTRQASIALQNLRVISEASKRLQEMNLLLEFSRQLSTLDSEKILRLLVEGVLEVIPAAQAGMAALWSPTQKMLLPVVALGYADNEKILKIPYRAGESLPGKAFLEGQALRQAEILFAQDYNLQQEHLMLYRDATQGKLPLSALVVPLQAFDEKLGVLVLDNFRETNAFTEDDQALVLALARQTALTLQNVNLVQATQARTAQLQTLTQVAGAITSSLQTEELIYTLLDQVKNVVAFDTGTLWLRQGDVMTIRAARGFEDQERREGLSVALKESLLLREMATTNEPLYVGDVRQDPRFPSLVEQPYLSWLGVPLLSKGEMIGVIVLEKAEVNFYSADQIQALITFAGQAAVALENARLYEESLRRARELDERSQRLLLLNRLSSELSGSLDLERILNVLTSEMLYATGASLISVALLNGANRAEVLFQAPSSDLGLPLVLSDSPILNRLCESLGVFSTEAVDQELEVGGLAEFLSRTGTKSLLIVPLIAGSSVTGFTFIHSHQTVHFAPEVVELATTINNQAAVAIQNAKLFQETERLIAETQRRSNELAALFDLGVQFTQILDKTRLLDTTFENVVRLIHPDAIVVALVEPNNQLQVHIYENEQRLEAVFVDRVGASFSEYVLQTNQPLLILDTQAPDLPAPGVVIGEPSRCWLGVPLIVRGVATGVISIQSAQPQAFDESHLQLLSQIANQLSVALDNAQLFQTVQTYTEELEMRVSERTEQVAREHRRIQTLLSITTELSASLDLDTVLNRTLGVVNETIEAEHSTILLVQHDSPYLYLRASLGYTGRFPSSGQVSQLKKDEGLAGWVIHNRQSVLIEDLHQDERWQLKSDRTSLHRSAMIVPLMVGEEILGVMMVFHRSPNMFTSDQLDLVQAVAKQIAIAINNAQLYGLIRDQAERLGDMLRTQHIETSRSQAILEAVADGVLVTDARRQITLFNASAENILGLSRAEVLGKSLEQFIGLFGKAAWSWVQTIRAWSEDPETCMAGETYAEQIELDNRRVVSVHLSPVHLRNDFLGTVSIFRDITHQVEVDRLKSEFVATVSHELRTPMTSIKGYVEILLMGAAGQLSPQQTHFLEVVKSNTERLAILVNDLLDVSRIEAGKVTLALQPLDLRPIAEEILQQFQQRMEKENHPLELVFESPQETPLVYGDAERIRQIFENLVENAYQYTPPGGKVSIRMRRIDAYIQVDVLDNGIGVKPEEKERIFERFYRGEDPLVLATSGTGLGLSIVKTLVEMHHGKIWFESEGIPGRGSVFSFTLPVYAPKLSESDFGQKEEEVESFSDASGGASGALGSEVDNDQPWVRQPTHHDDQEEDQLIS